MAAAAQSPMGIPEKDLYRIGEVSQITSTKSFVLRYWETEFPMLQPVKSPKGHRLYRHEDVETVRHIKHLLYDEGFTIAGARRHLSEGSAGAASPGYAAPGYAAQGHAAQAEENFARPAASPDAPQDRDFRGPQVEGAQAPLTPESELPGTQELSGARLSNHSSSINGATIAAINHAAADRPAGDHPVADRAVISDRAASDRAAVDHAAVGRAIVDRKVLLDLRDALRSLLTLLETE